MKTDNGEVKFRVMLQVAFYGDQDKPQCMWSPACVLEGESEIDGKPAKLILYCNGFTGAFDNYGSCSYSLLVGDVKTSQHMSRAVLSKVISYAGRFYQLKLESGESAGQVAKVVIEKDTSPTGELKMRLAGNENIEAGLSSATLVGKDDPGIQFNMNGSEVSTLPEGSYKMTRGNIRYGPGKDKWNVSFTKGPEITIDPNNVFDVEIGEPAMKVSAIEANKRYSSDAEEKTTYSKGTKIYLSPKVVGKAGELYGRLNRIEDGSYLAVKPEMEICDAEGKQVASQTLEYG